MLEDTCSTVVPATTPLVSWNLVLMETIETDEHLKYLETRSMHVKKYFNEKKANRGKDTAHSEGADEQDFTNFIGRLSDWLPGMH